MMCVSAVHISSLKYFAYFCMHLGLQECVREWQMGELH